MSFFTSTFEHVLTRQRSKQGWVDKVQFLRVIGNHEFQWMLAESLVFILIYKICESVYSALEKKNSNVNPNVHSSVFPKDTSMSIQSLNQVKCADVCEED